jgi:hypothetical protein
MRLVIGVFLLLGSIPLRVYREFQTSNRIGLHAPGRKDMYEHHTEPLLGRMKFLIRVFWHLLAAVVTLISSLGVGVLGYHLTEHLSWIDALLNASMILGGMGPVDPIKTVAGKLFASFYSLFSGIVFLVVAGILVAPLAHRILHQMHLVREETDSSRP